MGFPSVFWGTSRYFVTDAFIHQIFRCVFLCNPGEYIVTFLFWLLYQLKLNFNLDWRIWKYAISVAATYMVCIYAGKSISASEPLVLHSLLSSQSLQGAKTQRVYHHSLCLGFLKEETQIPEMGRHQDPDLDKQALTQALPPSTSSLCMMVICWCVPVSTTTSPGSDSIRCCTSLLAQLMQLILVLLSQKDFLNSFGYVFKLFRGWFSASSSPCSNYFEGMSPQPDLCSC